MTILFIDQDIFTFTHFTYVIKIYRNKDFSTKLNKLFKKRLGITQHFNGRDQAGGLSGNQFVPSLSNGPREHT